jgi:hypothetical protein
MWVNTEPDASQRFGVGPKPVGARHLSVIYGDTARLTPHRHPVQRSQAPHRTRFSVFLKA